MSTEQEKKWTSEEFKKELMDFHNRKPEKMDEKAFIEHLEHTTVYRYEKGLELVNEVEQFLSELKSQDKASNIDTDIMIGKLDRAVVAFAYGALRYNSTRAAGAPNRPDLWNASEE